MAHSFSDTNKREFEVHDNGNRPYQVIVKLPLVSIFRQNYVAEKDETYLFWPGVTYRKVVETRPVKVYKAVKRVYAGRGTIGKDDSVYNEGYGHTLLLYMGAKRHVYIGRNVIEFSLPEQVLKFRSYIGPNDVPYSAIMTKSFFVSLAGDPHTIHRDKAKEVSKAMNQNRDPHFHLYRGDYKTKPLKFKEVVRPKFAL